MQSWNGNVRDPLSYYAARLRTIHVRMLGIMEVSSSIGLRYIPPDSAHHTVDARKGSFDDLGRYRHSSLYLADWYIRDERV
jgi:hypothetical protein